MKIITGFKNKKTPQWDYWQENLKSSAALFDHDTFVFHPHNLYYEFMGLANYPELYLSLCWKYKVIFMEQALDLLHEDDLIWIDGDCLVQREINYQEVFEGCDIAFTLRDIRDRKESKEPLRDGYINSGVVFLKNNLSSRLFLKWAREELINSLYDQEAFNRVIIKHSDMDRHGEIININGIKVKMLDCREYNNFYLDATAEDARIVHFKGDGREEYEKWWSKIQARNG